jgi:NTP pyrophosphatase (non-canonical NTP hydrolase)
MGELGSELANLWREEAKLVVQGKGEKEARGLALKKVQTGIESELADCMAYLLKLANYVGIDLEKAYTGKMKANRARSWR